MFNQHEKFQNIICLIKIRRRVSVIMINRNGKKNRENIELISVLSTL